MTGGVLRGCFPGGESDDEALHGWSCLDEIRMVGPWVPDMCMPFGKQLMCTQDGYQILDSIGLGGSGVSAVRVAVANGRVVDRHSSLRRSRQRFRALQQVFESNEHQSVMLLVPDYPHIEAELDFRTEDGLQVAVARPLATCPPVGWLSAGGDVTFGCGLVPRLWIATERFQELSGRFPGWFRIAESLVAFC